MEVMEEACEKHSFSLLFLFPLSFFFFFLTFCSITNYLNSFCRISWNKTSKTVGAENWLFRILVYLEVRHVILYILFQHTYI